MYLMAESLRMCSVICKWLVDVLLLSLFLHITLSPAGSLSVKPSLSPTVNQPHSKQAHLINPSKDPTKQPHLRILRSLDISLHLQPSQSSFSITSSLPDDFVRHFYTSAILTSMQKQ